MRRRLWALLGALVAVGGLAGCVLPPDPGAPGASVRAVIVTPTPANVVQPDPADYRYAWAMIYGARRGSWLVQIGPKVDGSGIHLAIWAAQGCGPDFYNCGWTFFREYEAYRAGSVHTFEIARGPSGWVLSADGRVVETLDPGSDSPVVEVNLVGEPTAS